MELRPLEVGELLDRTFSLYRKHFLVFVGIAAIPELVLLLTQLAMIAVLFGAGSQGSPDAMARLSVFVVLSSGVVALLTYSVAQGATVAAVADLYLERPAGIGKAYADIKGRWLPLLVAMTLVSVVSGFGLVFCIVPGVLLMVAWSVTFPAVVVERMRPVEAMQRSWRLTAGSRPRIFLATLVVVALSYVINAICQLPGIAMAGVSGLMNSASIPVMALVALQVGNAVSACATLPLISILLSLVYYDQRVRKEGFDLQLMLSSLEPREGDPRPRAFS
jgi:hypothetical protein